MDESGLLAPNVGCVIGGSVEEHVYSTSTSMNLARLIGGALEKEGLVHIGKKRPQHDRRPHPNLSII